MKNSRLIILFLLIFSIESVLAQNVVTYSNISQTVTAEPSKEVSVKVMASCTGSSSTPILINPTYCIFDNGLTSINFSNGTYLLPGQQTEIIFKFKKITAFDETFTYKFSTNSSCLQEDSQMIKITVNYKKTPVDETGLPKPISIYFASYENKIDVKWSEVPGAKSYTVYYHLFKDGSTYKEITSSGTTKTISDLLPNTLYRVAVRAEPFLEGPFPPYLSSNWALSDIYTEGSNPPSLNGSNNICSTVGSGYVQRYTIFNMPRYYTSINWSVEPSYAVSVKPNTGNDLLISRVNGEPFTVKAVIKVSGKADLIFIKNVGNSCQVSALRKEGVINSPSNLIVSSACSSAGGICGAGNFQWIADENAILHEVEYMILNYSSNIPQPVRGSFQTKSSFYTVYNLNVNNNLQPWRINFRVRSQNQNGTWSSFSPWSPNVAW
jgi:hypothetical protein